MTKVKNEFNFDPTQKYTNLEGWGLRNSESSSTGLKWFPKEKTSYLGKFFSWLFHPCRRMESVFNNMLLQGTKRADNAATCDKPLLDKLEILTNIRENLEGFEQNVINVHNERRFFSGMRIQLLENRYEKIDAQIKAIDLQIKAAEHEIITEQRLAGMDEIGSLMGILEDLVEGDEETKDRLEKKICQRCEANGVAGQTFNAKVEQLIIQPLRQKTNELGHEKEANTLIQKYYLEEAFKALKSDKDIDFSNLPSYFKPEYFQFLNKEDTNGNISVSEKYAIISNQVAALLGRASSLTSEETSKLKMLQEKQAALLPEYEKIEQDMKQIEAFAKNCPEALKSGLNLMVQAQRLGIRASAMECPLSLESCLEDPEWDSLKKNYIRLNDGLGYIYYKDNSDFNELVQKQFNKLTSEKPEALKKDQPVTLNWDFGTEPKVLARNGKLEVVNAEKLPAEVLEFILAWQAFFGVDRKSL